MRQLLIAVIVVTVFSVAAWAQGPTSGSITGTVSDRTKAVLPGVTVTAMSPALLGTQAAVTNSQGQFRFPSLPPGIYSLSFELTGFGTVVREGIQVNIGFAADLHVELNLATLQETVTVKGASPVVDTQNTTVRNNFTAEMLKNIPNARDVWSLIAEAPGMTVSRFDVGGSTAGTQTGYTAYGSGGQNRVQVDGANTTEGTDAAGFYFDYGAFDEIAFGASNAADAQMPVPGVLINTVIKSGGNDLHGDAYFDYENESLQGNNVTDALRTLGVGRGTRTRKYFDPNVNVGGPIKRDKFWYFTSLRNQNMASTTTGWPFDAPGTGPDFLTKLQNITYKLTYQLNPNNRFTHFLQWGRKNQPYRNASATVSLDGVYYQDSYSWTGKLEWNRIVSPSMFFDARVATFAYNWPNLPYTPSMELGGGSSLAYRRQDQLTGNNAGGYSGYRYDRRRYQGEIIGNYFKDTSSLANHSIKFGWLTEWEQMEDEEFGNRDSIRLLYRSANGIDFSTPNQVQLQNGPTTYVDAVWHHGTFVQDQITVNPKLTVNAGLRWDYYNAYEPEQVVRGAPWRDFFYAGVPLMTSAGPFSLAPSAFSSDWIVPARPNLIVLKGNIAHRLGVAYDLRADGKTVLKANWGRFFRNPGASYSDDTNPIQWTVATFRWNDTDGNRLFSLNELGPFVSLSGGAVNTVEPGIDDSYTDEASAFLEREIVSDVGLRVGYVWKRQNRLWDLFDIARPRSLWNQPFTVADPGPDGLTGTADDGPGFTAYNMSSVTVSRRQWQAHDDARQSYKNIDVTLTKRMADRWSVVASYLFTWQNESWFTSPQNPNEDLNNYTKTTLSTLKVFGTYRAPWAIVISPVLRYQAGDPIPRRVSVSTNADTFTMLAEPAGAYREENVTIFDTRVEKQFRMSARRLSVFLDIFNINNSHAAQSQESITGRRTVTVDGARTQVARFQYPTVIIAPRILRFGARFSF